MARPSAHSPHGRTAAAQRVFAVGCADILGARLRRGRPVTVSRAKAVRASAAVVAAGGLAWAAPAPAASSYTVTITSPNLGTIISGASGDTLFHLDTNTGNVTVTSGTGVRTGVGAGRSQVTIACTGANGDCNKTLNIQLSPV